MIWQPPINLFCEILGVTVANQPSKQSINPMLYSTCTKETTPKLHRYDMIYTEIREETGKEKM